MTENGLVALLAVGVWLTFLYVRPAFLRAMVEARLADLRLTVLQVEGMIEDGQVSPTSGLARRARGLRNLSLYEGEFFPGPVVLLASILLSPDPPDPQPSRPLVRDDDHRFMITELDRCVLDVVRYKSLVAWSVVKMLTAAGLLDKGMAWMGGALAVQDDVQHRHA